MPRAAGAALLCILGLAASCDRLRDRRDARPGHLIAALARENHGDPAEGPRLSVGSPFLACAASGGCHDHARINDIAARAARQVREHGNAEALHVSALIDLLANSGTGKPLQRSISTLQLAAQLSERRAPILADLAGAYLVRAERAHTPRDLLSAIETAEQALEADPGNRVARFNRALALDRLGLAAEAARDWRRYLEIDSMSTMAEEAGRRLRAATRIAQGVPPRRPALDAPPQAFVAYAHQDPQGARLLGLDQVLGAWADAVLAGSPARAEAALTRATVLADILETRSGGDVTLADAVRAVRAADGNRLLTLATAHHEYADGRRQYEAAQFQASIPHFRAADQRAGGSPALRAWARVFLGTALAHLGDPRGERLIRRVVASADTVRHPALAARVRWSLAAILIRNNRSERALEPARASARLFRRAGEREHEGTAVGVLSDAQFALGEADASYASAWQALMLLQPYRGSVRLHNLLFSIADAAANDGLHRAAVRVEDEGVAAAERNGNPVFVAEARLARARLLASGGAFVRAERDVEMGSVALRQVTDPTPRNWLEADLRVTRALALPAANRARMAVSLDSAAALFRVRGNALRAFPVVVSAAEASLAARNVAGATARLETALAMLEQRRDSIQMEPRRAAVFESVRSVVERMVMLRLAARDVAGALRYMDRGRASLAPAGREARRRDTPLESRPGEVAVEYALVGDTLLAWTLSGRSVAVSRSPIDTTRLLRTIARLRTLLEQEAEEAEVEAALSQLYEWLIRPVESRLGPAETPLAVVADGELAAVPFAALRDARHRRYLIEAHPIRFTVSLQEERRSPSHPRLAEWGVVIIADPAFDISEHPGPSRLADAVAETRAIAAMYPRPMIVPDTQATRSAVEGALRSASLVHYAGHAVYNDERPEQSYLLLAPGRGDMGDGLLTAADLARLDLSHAPVVVLAACETATTGRGRTSGFTGFTGALLAAGAEGVVGGLWQVDDELTRPLMVEFHRAYGLGGDGPAALRAAQLRMLKMQDPELRSPAAWAGFRYAGR